jgi:hypothetical protein
MTAQHGPTGAKRKGGSGGARKGARPAAPSAGAKAAPAKAAPRKARGFLHAAALSSDHVRSAFSRRGFAESRVLTEWDAIVGEALAPLCRPVKVSYSAGGFGATLIAMTSGARAPEVEMLGPRIIERVNAFYGYRAISRFKVVQTARGMGAGGFAEPSRGFDRGGAAKPIPRPVSEEQARAVAGAVLAVESDALRGALDRLGRNIISRSNAAIRKDPS